MKVYIKRDTFIRGVPINKGTVTEVSDANDLRLLQEGRKCEPFDPSKHTTQSQQRKG